MKRFENILKHCICTY